MSRASREGNSDMSTEAEIWKPVPSAPGWMASNLGRVKARFEQAMPKGGFKTVEVQPTKGRLCKISGRFRMAANGRTRRVAQMVCEAFHGERPSSKHECMHLDENKQNDTPDNLQWGTKSENQSAPILNKLRSERVKKRNPKRKLSDSNVLAIKARGASARELASEYGISRLYVYQIWGGCRG